MTAGPLSKGIRGVRPKGYTLVELMIGVALGLLVLAAVASVFVSSRQTFRTQEGVAQVQETGRFLSYLMYPYIRTAGYLPDPLLQTDPAIYFVSPATAISGTENSAPPVATGVVASSVLANTDSISVRYLGRDASTSQTPLQTCLGNDVLVGKRAENTFYVGLAENGVSSLLCKARVYDVGTGVAAPDPAPQPLLLGVQNLQILYGVDSDADSIPNRYFQANNVANWTQVVAVRLTFTVDSADEIGTGQPGMTAGRLRRTFSTTLHVRNRLRA